MIRLNESYQIENLITGQDGYLDSKSVVLRRNGKLICRAIPDTAFADQIASRHYADAYAASSKPVISLALEFDRQSRGLIDWKKL